ncbi:MAG: DUF2069 domain-containing protein [Sulfuricellaceae bacterium]
MLKKPSLKKLELLNYTSIVSLVALIVLCVAWEGWLAPLHPGGSILIFKVLPLMLPLFGILHGRVYTHQWSSMLILLYFAEGVGRAMTDHGLTAKLALVETGLTLAFFFSAIFYARFSKLRG